MSCYECGYEQDSDELTHTDILNEKLLKGVNPGHIDTLLQQTKAPNNENNDDYEDISKLDTEGDNDSKARHSRYHDKCSEIDFWHVTSIQRDCSTKCYVII